jgi:signal transduction histidine kinase
MDILIADDDATVRTLLTRTLDKWGYSTIVCRDGAQAWEHLQRASRPTLAVLNWMMPGVSGVELCRRVRAQEKDDAYVYIILLTGRDSREDLLEGIEAGADEYLTKPVDSEELHVRLLAGQRVIQLQQRLVEENDARRSAMLELQKANAELGRSNAELQQFAYAVSHDLQEPLRTITSYVQLLGRRYRDTLDDDARDFIDFAVDGTKRMRRLISDLLQYSRVGTDGAEFEWVDADEALDDALANLQAGIEESDATIERDDLPEVYADRGQLVLVFQNLVANAIKFRGDESPHITINAGRQAGVWRFCVADNGIGIAPEYHERIFSIFQRLHTRNEYDGTGVGLAVCRKVVRRHGGKLWVESKPGDGARFCFTLPAEPTGPSM